MVIIKRKVTPIRISWPQKPTSITRVAPGPGPDIEEKYIKSPGLNWKTEKWAKQTKVHNYDRLRGNDSRG